MGSFPTRGATSSLLIQAQVRLTGEDSNLPESEQGGCCGQQGQHCADHQADPLLQRHLPLRLILRLTTKKYLFYPAPIKLLAPAPRPEFLDRSCCSAHTDDTRVQHSTRRQRQKHPTLFAPTEALTESDTRADWNNVSLPSHRWTNAL